MSSSVLLSDTPDQHLAQLLANHKVGIMQVYFRQIEMHEFQRRVDEAHIATLQAALRENQLRHTFPLRAIIRDNGHIPPSVSYGMAAHQHAQFVDITGQHRIVAHSRNIAEDIAAREPMLYPAWSDVPTGIIHAHPDAWWPCEVFRAGKCNPPSRTDLYTHTSRIDLLDDTHRDWIRFAIHSDNQSRVSLATSLADLWKSHRYLPVPHRYSYADTAKKTARLASCMWHPQLCQAIDALIDCPLFVDFITAERFRQFANNRTQGVNWSIPLLISHLYSPLANHRSGLLSCKRA